MIELTQFYRGIHTLCGKVSKMRIWGIPLAGGPHLYLLSNQTLATFSDKRQS